MILYEKVNSDISEMLSPPVGASERWVVLAPGLQFLYSRTPLRVPSIDKVVLSRNQCWASTQGQFPLGNGWVLLTQIIYHTFDVRVTENP